MVKVIFVLIAKKNLFVFKMQSSDCSITFKYEFSVTVAMLNALCATDYMQPVFRICM